MNKENQIGIRESSTNTKDQKRIRTYQIMTNEVPKFSSKLKG